MALATGRALGMYYLNVRRMATRRRSTVECGPHVGCVWSLCGCTGPLQALGVPDQAVRCFRDHLSLMRIKVPTELSPIIGVAHNNLAMALKYACGRELGG